MDQSPCAPRAGGLAALCGAWRDGHSLPGGFYTRADVFAQDMALLTNRWLCAGHVDDVRRPGDFMTAALGAESAIVTRLADGTLRAFANVCRHRGARLCAARGHAALLVCPYHAWSYRLDGTLAAARDMPDGFDRAAHGLTELALREEAGLVFISFGAAPPDFSGAAAALREFGAGFGWGAARIAARRTYRVRANWKLVLENYHECYHCLPAHPEFSAAHALAMPGQRRIGDGDAESWGAVPDGSEPFRRMQSCLSGGFATGSRDGRALAPPMRAVGFDGVCSFAEAGFLAAFLAYPDHGVMYRFMPVDACETEMELIWLVAGDARPGVDYDDAALTWLWHVTSLADKDIVERNQLGVASRFYEPGPYAPMEPGARQFVSRYVGEFSALCRAE